MASEVNIGGLYTLVDLMRMIGADGRATFIAQTLAKRNPFVTQMPIVEANQALFHTQNKQLSLPTVGKRALNDGAAFDAHKEIPVSFPMSLFEVFSKIDEEILALAGANADAVRQRKDAAFIEAMTQAVADELVYGSIGDDPLGFDGLSVLFDSTSTYPNNDSSSDYNVQSNNGTGSDTTSMYFIEPGEGKVHLIYPKGTQGGLQTKNLGLQLIDGSTAGTKLLMAISQFKWRVGLFVGDDRCVQRIANIESSGSSNIWNKDLCIAALNRLPNGGEDPGTFALCNRTIKTQMEIAASDKSNMITNNFEQAFGVPVLRFRGVRILFTDAILNTETAI